MDGPWRSRSACLNGRSRRVHDLEPVGQRLGLFEVVRRDQHRGAALTQVLHQPPHLTPALGVQAGRRLVEDHELRVAHQGGRQVDAAGLAAGQRGHAHVGLVLERQRREHLVDRARLRERPAPLAQRLADGQVAGEAAALEQHAGAAPDLGAVGDRVQPEHADLTGRRGRQPFDHLERRGLAGAVGAEQRDDRSGGRRRDRHRAPPRTRRARARRCDAVRARESPLWILGRCSYPQGRVGVGGACSPRSHQFGMTFVTGPRCERRPPRGRGAAFGLGTLAALSQVTGH